MSTESIRAIDVHGHYGRYIKSDQPQDIADFMTGDAQVVADRARRANIEWTIVSPLQALLPRFGGDPVGGNEHAARIVHEVDGLLQYVVIDPKTPATYEQADRMLKNPKCVGIKIHPEEHGYPIPDHGRKIFEFAAARKAIILTHSSEQNSLAADFVPFANDFPEVRLILAHIGCGWDGDLTHQVRAIQKCRHGNVFADTSSARSITPKLIEWAVKEIGVERVLFGTDTPLYHTSMHRVRIDHAELSDAEKTQILRDNAVRLFNLAERF
ncbi:MAG: amidohydrolase [Planctomycetaceae bacterium]|nr:amidohydrolase [Planctomycetaceae bacterium]